MMDATPHNPVGGQTVPAFGLNYTKRSDSEDLQPERCELGNAVGWGLAMTRVLVIDDDPLVGAAICTWLEIEGFEVVVADGAESGLGALERADFDVLIVDIFMPHMHGFESVRLFHQRAPMVPLIAISGYVFAENRSPAPDFLSMALELGASRCLRKPFTPTTLLTVIRTCLSENRAHREDVARYS
jgi:CheY-like chemotaxis protein